jgi:endonuclease YncB( thermonuclease family)
MFFTRAHPRKCLAFLLYAVSTLAVAFPALACGTMTGEARIAEATERLELKLEDGRLLRLAGLDAPQPELALDRLAANWTDRPLQVALLAPRPDRWGRWLADLAAPEGASLTDDLIRAGALRVKPEVETRNCEEPRLAAEQEARRLKLGLWREPHAIIAASDARRLAEADPGMVIVEGEVRRVGEGHSRVYLDFGGRDGFTVIVPRKAEVAYQRRGMSLPSLAGHYVHVRGYLENRFGLRIELADPLMIERTEGVGGSGPGG